MVSVAQLWLMRYLQSGPESFLVFLCLFLGEVLSSMLCQFNTSVWPSADPVSKDCLKLSFSCLEVQALFCTLNDFCSHALYRVLAFRQSPPCSLNNHGRGVEKVVFSLTGGFIEPQFQGKILFNNINFTARNYVFFLTLGSFGLELSNMESLNIIVTACNTLNVWVRSLDRSKMYFVTDFQLGMSANVKDFIYLILPHCLLSSACFITVTCFLQYVFSCFPAAYFLQTFLVGCFFPLFNEQLAVTGTLESHSAVIPIKDSTSLQLTLFAIEYSQLHQSWQRCGYYLRWAGYNVKICQDCVYDIKQNYFLGFFDISLIINVVQVRSVKDFLYSLAIVFNVW